MKGKWYWDTCDAVPTGKECEASVKDKIMFNLDVYEVADKYDVPNLLGPVARSFSYNLGSLIVPYYGYSSPLASKQHLLQIIERVYELTGAQSQSEMRDKLIKAFANSKDFKIRTTSISPAIVQEESAAMGGTQLRAELKHIGCETLQRPCQTLCEMCSCIFCQPKLTNERRRTRRKKRAKTTNRQLGS